MTGVPRLVLPISILLATIGVGTVALSMVEGWDLFDGFYMVLITVTTIGYTEVHQLSTAGRALNSLIILFGVGSFTYTVAEVMRALVERQLATFFRSRAMSKNLDQMSDHFVVCGAGRLGSRVIQDLARDHAEFVVIETDDDKVDRLVQAGVYCVHGDATDDVCLRRAGVERARGVVTTIGDDAQNVYICLSVRDLRSKLYIVARANSEEAESRLKRAGADRVVSPDRIGARQMTDALLRPGVIDFFDDVMRTAETDVNMEEIIVHAGSALDGVTIAAAGLYDMEVNPVLVRPAGLAMRHRPRPDLVLNAGDRLVVVGSVAALVDLSMRARAPRAAPTG